MIVPGVSSFLKKNYDRLIAAVVLVVLLSALVFLALQAKVQKASQQEFDQKLISLKPKFEKAGPADTAIFQNTIAAIASPLQIGDWREGLLLTPEFRVRCVGCERPVLYTATNCSFKACGAVQPPDRSDVIDANVNGIPDDWEKKFSLFAMDPKEVESDHDGDGFTAREEFEGDSDPRDSASHPSLVKKMSVVEIKPIDFQMIFKAVNRAGTNLIFQINLRANGRTFYKKIGEDAEGFTLAEYDAKAAEGPTLTLERSGKKISLIKGHKVPRDDYEIKIASPLPGLPKTVRPDVEFEFKEGKYRVKKVDIQGARVLINDVLRGMDIWIERQSQGGETASGKN